ncbi:MAG: hypothetical protein IPL25_10215 [Saprospiraceae bacterium]|nr:hypothetical protein [Candidatus Vicinibacter affinis]
MNGYLEQIEYLQSIELKDADGNGNSFSYFDYSNTPSRLEKFIDKLYFSCQMFIFFTR